MISIFILTLNEEQNIEECIRSVGFSDDVIVLDSFSQDNTSKKAELLGANIFQRKFDNYASQRNFGLSLDFKYDWILLSDADERVSPELLKEI